MQDVREESQYEEQWDVVRTIAELEHLDQAVDLCVAHTIQKMGRQCGIAPDGEVIMEHPLGQAKYAVSEALRACYVKYGKDLYVEAKSMDGQASFIDE